MPSVNKVTLIGHLGGDPVLKYIPNGTAVCEVGLATSRSYKQEEEWKQVTQWHNIKVWREAAERFAEKAFKGALTYVEGAIEYRTWDKGDGTKGYMTEIVADRVYVLDEKKDDIADEDFE